MHFNHALPHAERHRGISQRTLFHQLGKRTVRRKISSLLHLRHPFQEIGEGFDTFDARLLTSHAHSEAAGVIPARRS